MVVFILASALRKKKCGEKVESMSHEEYMSLVRRFSPEKLAEEKTPEMWAVFLALRAQESN